MTLITAKWTVDDYHQILATGILDERSVELLNGEIVEMVPEGEFHAYSSDEAGEYLIYLLGNRAKVRQGKPITFPDSNSEPEPDIAIVQRLGEVYQQHHPYPDNIYWVIEYSDSSLKKDLEVKTKLYATAGIPEYWILNLKQRCLIVFRAPVLGQYQSRQVYETGIVTSLAFPELPISLARLLGKPG
jgi:Uma2 family endonuclease